MDQLSLRMDGHALKLSLPGEFRQAGNFNPMNASSLRAWLKLPDEFLSLYAVSILPNCGKYSPCEHSGASSGNWLYELVSLGLCSYSGLSHMLMTTQHYVLPLKSVFGHCVVLEAFEASLRTLASILRNGSQQIRLPVTYLLLAASTYDDAFFRWLQEPCLPKDRPLVNMEEKFRPATAAKGGLPGSMRLAGV